MMAENVVEFPGASQAQSVITEDAVAELVVREHGENIRFCPEMGKWLKWSGLRWEVDETGHVFEMAKDVCRVVTVQTGKDKWGAHRTVQSVANFLKTRQDLVLRACDLDADPMKLGIPSGYVDLVTGKAMKPDRRIYTTKVAAVDPAKAGVAAPKWKAFLSEATGNNPELILFLQKMAGYILTGETTEQCLFFVYGPGGNGKSVFINTLAGIMGGYAKTAAMDTLQAQKGDRHSTDIAFLMGARLVTASETEEGKPWAEARVKQMTGSDFITARFMKKDNFTFRPEFKLLVVGNHKPALNTVDDAIRRRFNIIPFTYKPAEPNKSLEEDLRAEWPAILRWMIDGCTDWQAEEGMSRPAIVQAETAGFFEDQDLMQQWLDDNCTIAPGKHVLGADLYGDFHKYMEEAGEGRIGRKTFTQAIRRRGFVPTVITPPNCKSIRVVKGLTLNAKPSSGYGDGR